MGQSPLTPQTVLILAGTRPEAIKLLPVIQELGNSPWFKPQVILSGQHPRLAREIFEWAKIPILADLQSASGEGLNSLSSQVIQGFDQYIQDHFPDHQQLLVLVQGDTSSALGAALAAFHLGIPVAHIEAGLRSKDLGDPWPEEANRKMISQIASYHFAPTGWSAYNLHQEQIREHVYVTGNTTLDALRWARGQQPHFPDPRLSHLHQKHNHKVLITAHRRENWQGGIGSIARGIRGLAHKHPQVDFLVSMHPNPQVQQAFWAELSGLENTHLHQPLHFSCFAHLLSSCHFLISDSGGLQEEAAALDKPILVARDTTERPESLYSGGLRLVGNNTQRIAQEADWLLSDPEHYQQMAQAHNPYGDGQAASRIRGWLEHLIHGLPAQDITQSIVAQPDTAGVLV